MRAEQHRDTRNQRIGKVSRWGDGLGVSIPREAVQKLQLSEGDFVRFEICKNSLTIRRALQRKKWTERELLKGVTPEMVGGEIDWNR